MAANYGTIYCITSLYLQHLANQDNKRLRQMSGNHKVSSDNSIEEPLSVTQRLFNSIKHNDLATLSTYRASELDIYFTVDRQSFSSVQLAAYFGSFDCCCYLLTWIDEQIIEKNTSLPLFTLMNKVMTS